MNKIILISLLLVMVMPAANAQQVSLLFHSSLQSSELSNKVVRKIFLGRYRRSESGTTITPCYLNEARVLESVYRVSNKSEENFRRYWNKRLFSGLASAPKAFNSQAQLHQFVTSNKGAVCITLSEKEIPVGATAQIIK